MSIENRPLVSVVIPTYNHAWCLGRAIQSVIDQTYKNWEIIIVDNNSTDNTSEIILNFTKEHITHLKIKNNGIIAKSRNKGIKSSRGEWIAFLDSDDWWEPYKLECLFERNLKDVDFSYHGLNINNESNRHMWRKKIKTRKLKHPIFNDLLLYGNPIGNSSVVVRKKIIEEIGYINSSEKMIACEDYNTWLKISKITNNFLFISEPLGHYSIHPQSASQKNMSTSEYEAIFEFLKLESNTIKSLLIANIRYISGAYNCKINNYIHARNDLVFVIFKGRYILKLKAMLLLLKLIFKKIF
ncbi:glycosyltransferase [Amylibacter sp.]|nr:glycosyltransferase [Amylibacter sp.]